MRYVLPLALLLSATVAHAQWYEAGVTRQALKASPEHDGFGAMQIATTEPDQLEHEWAQPTPGVHLPAQDEAARNQRIFTYITFGGCRAGPDGNCDVTARFDILDPQGKPYGPPQEALLWNHLPMPPGNLQLGQAAVGLQVEPGKPLGKYRVIAHTTDHVANITLTTEQTLTITEAPN